MLIFRVRRENEMHSAVDVNWLPRAQPVVSRCQFAALLVVLLRDAPFANDSDRASCRYSLQVLGDHYRIANGHDGELSVLLV